MKWTTGQSTVQYFYCCDVHRIVGCSIFTWMVVIPENYEVFAIVYRNHSSNSHHNLTGTRRIYYKCAEKAPSQTVFLPFFISVHLSPYLVEAQSVEGVKNAIRYVLYWGV